MSAMASQNIGVLIVNSTVWCRLKNTSKLRVTGLCDGNSAMTSWFPAQRAIHAENVSIWWRHDNLVGFSRMHSAIRPAHSEVHPVSQVSYRYSKSKGSVGLLMPRGSCHVHSVAGKNPQVPGYLGLLANHDDVIKWKHFPRNWPFVRGIHRSRWIPRTMASDAELWCFLWSASEYTID